MLLRSGGLGPSERPPGLALGVSVLPALLLAVVGEFGFRPGGSYCWIADHSRTDKVINHSWLQVIYLPMALLLPCSSVLYLRTIYGILHHDRRLRKSLATPKAADLKKMLEAQQTRSPCDRLLQACVTHDISHYWLFKYYRPILFVAWIDGITVVLSGTLMYTSSKMDVFEESFEKWATCVALASGAAGNALGGVSRWSSDWRVASRWSRSRSDVRRSSEVDETVEER